MSDNEVCSSVAQHPATAKKNKWWPLLSIRPGADGKAIVSDPVKRRHAVVDPTALLALLGAHYRGEANDDTANRLAEKLGGVGWFPAAPVEPGLEKQMRHWWDRGWTSSLRYYLWSRGRPQLDARDTTGEIRSSVITNYLSEAEAPPRDASDALPVVTLQEPTAIPETLTVGQLLLSRRSARSFPRRTASAGIFSSVLWHGLQNVRQRQQRIPKTPIDYLRSYGIAFDFHIAVFDVEGIEPGIYHYDIVKHCLLQYRLGDFRAQMTALLVGMQSPMTASWTLLISADVPRYQWRYRHEHALRNLYTGAGRVAQLVTLIGHAHDFGSVPTPALLDTNCSELFGLNPTTQIPIYTVTMGPLSS